MMFLGWSLVGCVNEMVTSGIVEKKDVGFSVTDLGSMYWYHEVASLWSSKQVLLLLMIFL